MLSPLIASCAQLFHTLSTPVVLIDGAQIVQYLNPVAQQTFSISQEVLELHRPLPPFLSEHLPGDTSSTYFTFYDISYEMTCHALDAALLLFFYPKKEPPIPPQLLRSIQNNIQTVAAPLTYAAHLLAPAVETAQDPKADQYLGVLNQNCYRLNRIAHMLSVFERSLDPTPLFSNTDQCDIGEVCYKVAELVKSIILQMQLHFTVEIPAGTYIVRGKSLYFEHMLYQLLSNAIKFTPASGSISLTVKANSKRVYISVQDTGEGIPKHILNTVFHRFSETFSLTDINSGIGLGLFYVRYIVSQSNGIVALTSKPGKGTNVTATFPLEKPSPLFRTPSVALESSGGFSTALVDLADALPPFFFSHSDLE